MGCVHVVVVEAEGRDGARAGPGGDGVGLDGADGLLAQDQFLLVGFRADEDGAHRQEHLGGGGDVGGGVGEVVGEGEGSLALVVGSDGVGGEDAVVGLNGDHLADHRLAALGYRHGEELGCVDGVDGAGGGDGHHRQVGSAGVGGDGVDDGPGTLTDGGGPVGMEAVGEVPDRRLAGGHLLIDVGEGVGPIWPGGVSAQAGGVVEEEPADGAGHHLVAGDKHIPRADVMAQVGAEGGGEPAAAELEVHRAAGVTDRLAIEGAVDGGVRAETLEGTGLSGCPGEGDGGQEPEREAQDEWGAEPRATFLH